MFTKTALTAAMIIGTASAALALDSFDPNPANRYPHFAGPVASARTFQSAPVVLEGRNVALGGSQVIIGGTKAYDRAGGNVDSGTSN